MRRRQRQERREREEARLPPVRGAQDGGGALATVVVPRTSLRLPHAVIVGPGDGGVAERVAKEEVVERVAEERDEDRMEVGVRLHGEPPVPPQSIRKQSASLLSRLYRDLRHSAIGRALSAIDTVRKLPPPPRLLQPLLDEYVVPVLIARNFGTGQMAVVRLVSALPRIGDALW